MFFPPLGLREDLGRTMPTGTYTREVFASLWLPADATLLVFHHTSTPVTLTVDYSHCFAGIQHCSGLSSTVKVTQENNSHFS